MALFVTNAGERQLLEWAVKSTGGDTKLKIFINDASLTPAMLAAALTEATFTGYTARTLARASWLAALTNTDGKAQLNFGVDQTFNFGSDQSIYGHYWTDSTDVLIAVEKYSVARNQLSGDEFVIQPRLTFTTTGSNAIITDAGERLLLDWILRGTGANLTLRLFKTNVVPTATSVIASFTESDFVDYAAKTLTRANWNSASTNGSGHAEIAFSIDQQFDPGSTQDVWGYMLTHDSTLVMAERYSAVRSIGIGDTFIVQPRLTLQSES